MPAVVDLDLSASSWPGLTRPSRLVWQARAPERDRRVKPAMTSRELCRLVSILTLKRLFLFRWMRRSGTRMTSEYLLRLLSDRLGRRGKAEVLHQERRSRDNGIFIFSAARPLARADRQHVGKHGDRTF